MPSPSTSEDTGARDLEPKLLNERFIAPSLVPNQLLGDYYRPLIKANLVGDPSKGEQHHKERNIAA